MGGSNIQIKRGRKREIMKSIVYVEKRGEEHKNI